MKLCTHTTVESTIAGWVTSVWLIGYSRSRALYQRAHTGYPQTTRTNTVLYSAGISVALASRSGSDTSEARVLSSTSSLLNGGCAMLTRNLSAFSCTTGAHRPVGIRRGRPTSRSAIGVCLRTLTFPLNSSTNKPHRIPTGYWRYTFYLAGWALCQLTSAGPVALN